MQNSELCCSDYRTEEENERLENARKEFEKVLLELERKPMMLWRLFRETALLDGGECRDIVEKHVLPRLNANDVKFLYEVNSETRKLIKRSTRAGDLKKWFKVSEMSSISTLEFVWENKSLWSGYLYDETDFCRKLLGRINSSCSSGRERRKSVRGVEGRLIRPHIMVIWKW